MNKVLLLFLAIAVIVNCVECRIHRNPTLSTEDLDSPQNHGSRHRSDIEKSNMHLNREEKIIPSDSRFHIVHDESSTNINTQKISINGESQQNQEPIKGMKAGDHRIRAPQVIPSDNRFHYQSKDQLDPIIEDHSQVNQQSTSEDSMEFMSQLLKKAAIGINKQISQTNTGSILNSYGKGRSRLDDNDRKFMAMLFGSDVSEKSKLNAQKLDFGSVNNDQYFNENQIPTNAIWQKSKPYHQLPKHNDYHNGPRRSFENFRNNYGTKNSGRNIEVRKNINTENVGTEDL